MTIPLKSFYFIRHGETDWNKRGLIMGSKDIELNSHGISQAEEAKHGLKDEDIGEIYASSLKRASHTANILNQVLNLPITYTDLLWERGWGVSEGDHVDSFKTIFAKRLDDIEDHEIPIDAETWTQFRARIIIALMEILKDSQKPPLIVSHGGVLRGITAILGIHDVHPKNCEAYLFRPSDGISEKWSVVSLEDSM